MSDKENGSNISSKGFDVKSVIELAKSKLGSDSRNLPDENKKNQRRSRDLRCKSICVSDVSMGLVSNRRDSWEVSNRRQSLKTFNGNNNNENRNGDPSQASKLVSGLRRNTESGDFRAKREMRDFKSRSFCSTDVSAGLVSRRTDSWELGKTEGIKKHANDMQTNNNDNSITDKDTDTKNVSKLVAGPRFNGTNEEKKNRRALRDFKSRSLCGAEVGSGLVSKRTDSWEVFDTQKEKRVTNRNPNVDNDNKPLNTDLNNDNDNKEYNRRSLIDSSNSMFYTGGQTNGVLEEKRKKREERDRRSRSFCSVDVDSGLVAKRKELFGKFQNSKIIESNENAPVSNIYESSFNGVKLREKPPNINRDRPKSFCYGAKESVSKIEQLKNMINENKSMNDNKDKKEFKPVIIENINIDSNMPVETPKEPLEDVKEETTANTPSLVTLRTKQLNSFNRDRPKSFCFGAKEGFSKIEHLKNKIKENGETKIESENVETKISDEFKNEVDKNKDEDNVIKNNTPTSEVIMRDRRPNINRNRPKSFCLGTKESLLKVAQLNNLVNESKEEFLSRIAASPVLMKKDKKMKLPIKKKEKTIKEEVVKVDKEEITKNLPPDHEKGKIDTNIKNKEELTKKIDITNKLKLDDIKNGNLSIQAELMNGLDKNLNSGSDIDTKQAEQQVETVSSSTGLDFSEFDTETDLCLAMIAEAEEMNRSISNNSFSLEIKRSSVYQSKQRFPTTNMFYSEAAEKSKTLDNTKQEDIKSPRNVNGHKKSSYSHEKISKDIENSGNKDSSKINGNSQSADESKSVNDTNNNETKLSQNLNGTVKSSSPKEIISKDIKNLSNKNSSTTNGNYPKTITDKNPISTVSDNSFNEKDSPVRLRPKSKSLRGDRPKSMDFSLGMRSSERIVLQPSPLMKDIPLNEANLDSDLSRIASTEVLERNSKKRLTLKKKKKKISSADIDKEENTNENVDVQNTEVKDTDISESDVGPTSVCNEISPIEVVPKPNPLPDTPSVSVEKRSTSKPNIDERLGKGLSDEKGIRNKFDLEQAPPVVVDCPALIISPDKEIELENNKEPSMASVKLRSNKNLKHLRNERPKSMDFSCGLSAKERIFLTSSRLSNNSSFDEESSESDLSRIASTEAVDTNHKRRLTLRKKKGKTSPLVTESRTNSDESISTETNSPKDVDNGVSSSLVHQKNTSNELNEEKSKEKSRQFENSLPKSDLITNNELSKKISVSNSNSSPEPMNKVPTLPTINTTIPQNGENFNVVTQKPPKPAKVIRRPKLSRLLSNERPKTTDFSSLKTIDLTAFSDKSSDIEPIVESDLSRIATTDAIQRNSSKRLTLKKKKKKSVVNTEEDNKSQIDLKSGESEPIVNSKTSLDKLVPTQNTCKETDNTSQNITSDISQDDSRQLSKSSLHNKNDNITDNTSDKTNLDKVSDKQMHAQNGISTTKSNDVPDKLQNGHKLPNKAMLNGKHENKNELVKIACDISLDKNDNCETNPETNTEINSKRTVDRNTPKTLTGIKRSTSVSPTSQRSPSNTPKSPISPTSPTKVSGFTRDRRRHSVKDMKNLFDQNSSVTYRKKERTIIPTRPRSMDFSCFLNQDDKKSLSFLSRIDKCRDDLKVTNV